MGHSKRRKNHSKREVLQSSAFELLLYELKPFIYVTVAALALNSSGNLQAWVKYSCFLVLTFSLYIIYGRLEHRGIIGKTY